MVVSVGLKEQRASGGNRTRELFLTKEARYHYATEAPHAGTRRV